jgi:hypothetical protein
MDYAAAIERVYDQLENDQVDKAIMTCLRIARNLQDFLYAAVFLREMYPNKHECIRILYDDTSHLKKDAQKFIWEHSLEYWLDTHTLDFSLGTNDKGKEKNVLAIGISEIDPELEQWERSIADLQVPSGMGEYDTAAFTDQYTNQKAQIRLRMKAMQTIKQRVKTRCLNYAIRIERQLQAQNKSQSFLAQIHTDVNNYFKAHSEEVYTKLHKASQLVDSNDPEDYSLLLTQVRRAMMASADFLYPPAEEMVICADGKERLLGKEQYLNRLQEFLATTFAKSSSSDLLLSELEYLSVFARRLNVVASKGVHTDVSPIEAKQGLLGLYMFLYNVTSRLEQESS